MKRIFNNISFGFLLLLIIYMPVASLLANFLEWRTGLGSGSIFWLTRWYEFAAILLLVGTATAIISKKQRPSKSQISAWALLILGILSTFFLSPSASQGLEGLRAALFGLVFYLLAREINISNKWLKNTVNTYLVVAALMAIWALLERFLPLRYWSGWGLIDPEVVFGYGWHSTGNFFQSASFLGGPNQLASYLLPAFFLLVTSDKLRVTRVNSKKLVTCLLFLVTCAIAAAIALSSSRSAIAGLIAGIIVLILTQKNRILKIGASTGLGISVIFVLWFLTSSAQLREFVTHGASQAGHVESLKITLQEVQARFHEPIKLIFGAGVGTAGPIAIKYGGIISESWYFQILLELGVVGLLLYLVFFYHVGDELWRKKEKGLFLGLTSVLVTALFLHTLSDNPSLTYTLFALIGLGIGKESNG